MLLLLAAALTLCDASPPLLSKHLWNDLVNNLTNRDGKKFGMVQAEFQKFSAHENVKAKYYPENQLPWGFYKHFETGDVIIENDSGILPWNEEMRFAQSICNYEEPHEQMKPFIRCMAHCFDLTDMFTTAFVELTRVDENDFRRVDLIKSLIDANVKVNKNVKHLLENNYRYERSPLSRAYKNGSEDTAKLLIQLGANVNAKRGGLTILQEMAVTDWGEPQKKILKMLIEAGADMEAKTAVGASTPLSLVTLWNRPEIARALIEANANIEARDSKGRTALHDAVSLDGANSKEVLRVLLEAGANTEAKDYFGQTAFDCALVQCEVEAARMLLKATANKNINATNSIGQTALHRSVLLMSELNFAKMLIEEGVDIDAKDDMGRTALLFSVLLSQTNFTRMLIEEGADTNVKDDKGETALHQTSRFGRNILELVQMLVDAGANPNVKDNSGSSRLDIALRWNEKEVVQIFLKQTSIDYSQALQVALKNGNVALGIILIMAAAKHYSKLFLLISLLVCIFSIFLRLN